MLSTPLHPSLARHVFPPINDFLDTTAVYGLFQVVTCLSQPRFLEHLHITIDQVQYISAFVCALFLNWFGMYQTVIAVRCEVDVA